MIDQLEKKLLIQPGERRNVVYFLVFFMLVSAGMAIGRSTADALFLKRLGIEYLPLMYIIQSAVLAAVSLVYAAFADRIPAERFFRALFVTLATLVLASWFAMSTNNSLVYPAYYLLYEIASEVLLVHAALYMNQNMTTLQAKRLAPLVYAGAQTGTIIGGLVLVVAAEAIGTRNLLLAWCILLASGAAFITLRHRKYGTSTHFRTPKKSQNLLKDCIEQVHQGVRFTFRTSLLRAASLALFFMVLSFYILCYSINRIYTQTFDTEESLTQFFGLLTAATSAFALLAQLFITNRAIRHFGVRTINLLFPWTTLACLVSLAFSFTIPSALLGSFNKDTLMPAFRNPVRSMFFNVLPDYMQGRARAMSIALVLPLALMVCGLILIVMQQMDSPLYFLLPGILSAGLYLFFSHKMNKAYVGTLLATLKERLFLPDKHMYSELQGTGKDTLDKIMRGINNSDTEVSLAFAKILTSSFPDKAAAIIIKRAENMDNAAADNMLGTLRKLDISSHTNALLKIADNGDTHLKTTVTRMLLEEGDRKTAGKAVTLLASENPREQSTAIHAALLFPETAEVRKQVLATWKTLLQHNTSSRCAALDNIVDLALLSSEEKQSLLPRYLDAFTTLLSATSESTRLRALHGLANWKDNLPTATADAIRSCLSCEDPALRQAAVRCLPLLDQNLHDTLLFQALGDGHIRVRETAIDILKAASGNHKGTALEWIQGNIASLRAQQTLLESLLDAQIPRSAFEDIAREKSKEVLLLQDAVSVLESHPDYNTDTAWSLLKFTLREQLNQTIELILLAMESLYNRETIQIIHAGFTSGDSRHIANACEALENLDKDTLTSNLSDALQRSTGGDSGKHSDSFTGIDDVLRWCANHDNNWLSQCGKRALENGSQGDAYA